MLGYFGIFTFLGLGSIIEQMTENKRMREKIFIFSLLLLILFFGLRGYIGYDWYSYKPNFDVIPTFTEIVRGDLQNFNFGYEIGFQIYTVIIKSFTSNYFIYNFVNTSVDMIILFFVLRRYSNYPILSLLIFFGVYGIALEIDMLRNVKSIMLFLLSIEYIERREILKFGALNILGILFHTSSLLYLPMYFILNIKWNKKIILLLFILGSIYYFSDLRIMMRVIKEYNNILPIGVGRKLSGYFSIIPLDFPLGWSVYYIERLIFFLLAWSASETLQNKKYGNIMLNSLYISIFFFLYLSEFSIMAMRFGILFVYSYWFILPMLLDIYPKAVIVILAIAISIFRIDNQINFIGNREVYSYQNILINSSSVDVQRSKIELSTKYKEYGHGKEISLLF